MAQSRSRDDNLDSESEITLGLLNAVHENSGMTQRSMAHELEIALGLANAYFKRCVRKGFIKVRQIPSNRYSYYLTPKGFTEKSRLTSEYLSSSLNFFRRARSQCSSTLDYAAARGWNRVALAGVSDLAEIMTLCALDSTADLVGIYDVKSRKDLFLNLSVVTDLAALGEVDAVIITDTAAPQAVYEQLLRFFPGERVLTPDLLGVVRNAGAKGDPA